jgi:hypothetical protein
LIESGYHDEPRNEENGYGRESWSESENMICAFCEISELQSDGDEEILGCPHIAKTEMVHSLPTDKIKTYQLESKELVAGDLNY